MVRDTNTANSSRGLKTASVVGVGDVFKGDLGLACYVLEALGREIMRSRVTLSYLAEDSMQADACIYGTDLAIIVQAIPLGLLPGRVTSRNHKRFLESISYLREQHHTLAQLELALNRTAMAGGLPEDILFVWIEPVRTEGVGLSREGKKALRTAVRMIKEKLFRRGFIDESSLRISAICRLPIADSVV